MNHKRGRPKHQRQGCDCKLAYLAGVFDGEGCVTAQRLRGRNGNVFLVRVVVGNGFLPVLKEFQRFAGGSINERRAPAGMLRQFQWALSSRQAAAFLQRVLPHLVVKREVATLALRLQALITHEYLAGGRRGLTQRQVERRERIVRRCHALNARGWRGNAPQARAA